MAKTTTYQENLGVGRSGSGPNGTTVPSLARGAVRLPALFILIASALVLSAGAALAEEQSTLNTQDYAVYIAAGKIGTDIFMQRYNADLRVIRTYVVLQSCGKDGLATSVKSKLKDPQFMTAIKNMIQDGRFDNLPPYAALSAQSFANRINAGYELGYKEALSFSFQDPDVKTGICAAAVKMADDILK